MIVPGKRYHFIGIGGAGMSGLAAVMLAGGAHVSGSDLTENAAIQSLKNAGARVQLGHNPNLLLEEKIERVIVSSAIGEENLELQAARKRDLPIVPRLRALASVLSHYRSIGVAGTHGKTTTTAMISTILEETGKDPSCLIGAHCPHLGSNSRLGTGDLFVTEVDESDGLFLALHPTIGVLNNIGRDHLSTYGNLAAIKKGFTRYIRQAEQAVLAVDDEHVFELAVDFPAALKVGLSREADLRATKIWHHRFETRFDLTYRDQHVCSVFLPAPGDHNVRNALCAIGAAHLAGVDLKEAAAALHGFRLPQRRFQLLEENGVTVVGDYAHLPEEIDATLKAIEDGWKERRIVAVFQPHRYSRTQTLGAEFGEAFRRADTVVVTPIYPASERPIPGVSSRQIVNAIAQSTSADLRFIPSKKEVVSFLKTYIEPGDFIISFGAGDIWTVTEELSCFLKEGSFCTTS